MRTWTQIKLGATIALVIFLVIAFEAGWMEAWLQQLVDWMFADMQAHTTSLMEELMR